MAAKGFAVLRGTRRGIRPGMRIGGAAGRHGPTLFVRPWSLFWDVGCHLQVLKARRARWARCGVVSGRQEPALAIEQSNYHCAMLTSHHVEPRRQHLGAQVGLALAATYNWAVNTDAQRRPAAARPTLSGRRLLLR